MLFLFLLLSFSSNAEPAPMHELTLVDHELGGPGGTWLVERARSAQFVLIGESHNKRELPALVGDLYLAIQPAGFQHVALETGRITTRILNDMAKREDGVAAMTALMRRFPYAVPFYDQVEEFAMLRQIAAKSTASSPFWGLDQEFALAPRMLLARLKDKCTGEETKALADRFYAQAMAGAVHYAKTGEDARLFGQTAELETFEEMARVMADETDPEVALIIEEMKTSWVIYDHYRQGRYRENNRTRTRLFKTNFMGYYDAARKEAGHEPKVMLKMGSYHAGRGLTPVNMFDIGTFLSELADGMGKESFHIQITARLFRDGEGKVTYDLAKEEAYWAPYLTDTDPAKIWVLDLTALRGGKMREAPLEIRRTVFGYDALVILPVLQNGAKLASL